jgi:hypothetical protein
VLDSNTDGELVGSGYILEVEATGITDEFNIRVEESSQE